MQYAGKDITSFTDDELISIYNSLCKQEENRTIASRNGKFVKNRNVGGAIVTKMSFPPPNPAFLELKSKITDEINKRELKVT